MGRKSFIVGAKKWGITLTDFKLQDEITLLPSKLKVISAEIDGNPTAKDDLKVGNHSRPFLPLILRIYRKRYLIASTFSLL